MAQHIIEAPDGTRHVIDAPDDATPDEIEAFANDTFKPSQMESLGRGAVQGVTFNTSDEIYGAAKGVYDKLFGDGDYGGTYARERDAVRAANDRASEANPGTYLAGELAAAVALPFGAAKAGYRGVKAANAGLGARSAAAAKEGAAYGGAYALGGSEGDWSDKLMQTAGGVVAGGALGSAVPAAIQLGGAVLRTPMQIKRVLVNPDRVAAEKVAEGFARDAGAEIVPTGGVTPVGTAVDRLTASHARGDTAMILADHGGENVQNLIKAATNMPNAKAQRFKEVLDRRAATQGRRLASKLETELAGKKDYTDTLDGVVTERAKNAVPAFKAAYSAPFKVQADGALSKFLQRGYMSRLLEKTKQTVSGMTGKQADDLDSLFDTVTPLGPKETKAAAEMRDAVGPLQPGEAQALFDQFKYAKTMRSQGKPQALTDYLIKSGGVQNQSGELRHILGRVKDRPGLVHGKGMTLDEAALSAWEKGFINTPERPTIREFLDHLDDDLAGKRNVRAVDQDALDDLKIAAEMADDLERMGIRTDMSDRVVKEGLGLAQSTKRLDVAAEKGSSSWEMLHRVKMEINREISRLKRGEKDDIANWTLNDLKQLNKEYGELIAQENPKLGSALKGYSDESGLMNALEDGADDFFKLTPEELTKKINGLPTQEAELYRIGATRAQVLRLREGDVMRDRTKSLYNSDDMGKRISAVFPEGKGRGEFMRTITAERKMAATRRSAQGNSSTVKQLTHAKEAGKSIDTAMDVVGAGTGHMTSAVRLLSRAGNLASGITPRVAAEILNLGMQKGGTKAGATSNRAIEEAFARGQARKVRQGLLTDLALPAPGLLSADFARPQRAGQ